MSKVQSCILIALNELRRSKSLSEINEALARLAIGLGCQYFLLAKGPQNPLPLDEDLRVIGNFPAKITQIYDSEITAICDPARFCAINSGGAVPWRSIFLETKGQKERQFIASLREVNMKDGVSIPVHGPGGCTAILMFASSEILNLNSEEFESLTLVAYAVLQRFKRIIAAKLVGNQNSEILSERESECLSFVLQGKTNWEIGILLGVAPRTVQFHLANCQRKFGVNNRIQAAMSALLLGQIELPAQYRGENKKAQIHFETKGLNFQNIASSVIDIAFERQKNLEIHNISPSGS